MNPTSLFIIFKIVLNVLDTLLFHTNFRICFQFQRKKSLLGFLFGFVEVIYQSGGELVL